MSSELKTPDRSIVQHWLNEAGIECSICGECPGLHLPTLQVLDGVAESRVFVEDYGLVLSTELELRQVAVLLLAADCARLNMDYPLLKIFQDVVDDALPQLVAAAVLPTQPGVMEQQFIQFFRHAIEATSQLVAECLHLEYLYLEPENSSTSKPQNPIH